MKNESPQTIYLKDYSIPNYKAEKTYLEFDLYEDHALVTSKVVYSHNEAMPRELNLDGNDLELKKVLIDNKELQLSELDFGKDYLKLVDLPKEFELSLVTKTHPQSNTSLEGLYKSGGKFCTQCEAQGFRKITYYQDRPDVMSVFTSKVIANKEDYPVLLSNGNPVERGETADGRHFVVWNDPFKKPSYLFALVAGKLECVKDSYKTKSGRDVKLEIFVEADDLDKCDYAMKSLKESMKWDEERFDLEYDLDIYMIVAVSDFNMGAMENKGLNIFNSKYVLANKETGTDSDFELIEGVIGHEYFHNWTGNRVTCRDWFQLSLKEGLTVFRDQEFSSDLNSRGVKRIGEVKTLRNAQFVEDAGPMTHPIRPEQYIEINNFYTATVYNKGAEVIRMIHTMLGEQDFQKGIKLYFERFDGMAVTTEDFVKAMSDASGVNLDKFRRWYSQAGTPSLNVALEETAGGVSLHMKQTLPKTPETAVKEAQVLPIRTAFFNEAGEQIEFSYNGSKAKEHVILVEEFDSVIKLDGLGKGLIPSLARDFSAPIKLSYDYSEKDLELLLSSETDAFNLYEAFQKLSIMNIQKKIANKDHKLSDSFISSVAKLLISAHDRELKSVVMSLPSVEYMATLRSSIDLDATYEAVMWMHKELATNLEMEFLAAYKDIEVDKEFKLDGASRGNRALRSLLLSYLNCLGSEEYLELAQNQYDSANNMTDTLSAMSAVVSSHNHVRENLLSSFYDKWKGDKLLIDKWFLVQCSTMGKKAYEDFRTLLNHKDFDILNPNRVYSSVRAFNRLNPNGLHRSDGEGYKLMADYILKIDKNNGQVAARVASSLIQWRKFDENRQKLMKSQLERIVETQGLSKNVYEIVSKSLV